MPRPEDVGAARCRRASQLQLGAAAQLSPGPAARTSRAAPLALRAASAARQGRTSKGGATTLVVTGRRWAARTPALAWAKRGRSGAPAQQHAGDRPPRPSPSCTASTTVSAGRGRRLVLSGPCQPQRLETWRPGSRPAGRLAAGRFACHAVWQTCLQAGNVAYSCHSMPCTCTCNAMRTHRARQREQR